MWIENVAATDVSQGFHHDAGPNSMLIQIADPAGWFPVPKYQFKEIYQFEFLDAEDADDFPEEAKCTDEQAVEIVRLLQHALDNHMNVVVHCTAGICRSGAVCELGVMLGFNDCERFRSPNLRVKHRMMKALGWTYDPMEKPNVDDWRTFKHTE
jgi:predicted protein tyrosine phosphatase